MNFITAGIIIGLIVLTLSSIVWIKRKETTLKKKVKTVEDLYPGVPFKKKDETLKAETTLIKNAAEPIINHVNTEKVVRSNDHVKHPYKRKRKK